jgi:hypothetical protein
MEEETKFEIKDKRTRFTDETEGPLPTSEPAEKPKQDAEEKSAPMPVTFVSFILSLATSALMHLGQEGPPQGGKPAVHLPLARQVIDLISLLEEKTKGNLTPSEEEMISQTLFALRIKFVEIEKKLRC